MFFPKLGVLKDMNGLTSEVAIEEFLKQGVHNRVAKRAIWPEGNTLVQVGEDVFRLNADGTTSELTDEDLEATDWALNEHEFL